MVGTGVCHEFYSIAVLPAGGIHSDAAAPMAMSRRIRTTSTHAAAARISLSANVRSAPARPGTFPGVARCDQNRLCF